MTAKANYTDKQGEPYVYWHGKKFEVPQGFERVRWEDTQKGQYVYIVGTRAKFVEGELLPQRVPTAYGPHQMVCNKSCILVNSQSQHFSQRASSRVLIKS